MDSHQIITKTLFQDYLIPILLNMMENLSYLLISGKSTREKKVEGTKGVFKEVVNRRTYNTMAK